MTNPEEGATRCARLQRRLASMASVRVPSEPAAWSSKALIPAVPINAAATLVAVWSPYVALARFGALELFYVLGSSLFERD